ncbi:uncharacterized protein LOC106059162 [Biomphalaria glabrata]|uniref:Uncharacterized protein LOC106059162 n=1 Tax=Biomphalaria glabrata TaxID=6526 RepID=A0A9U8E482_BIOGL|nr:uncharacterized protein LOC106059162 [Biomphalaria glabrata]XP_055872496.1 uncharacterized protein LOC106059162 [Biomphalaria glabrata]
MFQYNPQINEDEDERECEMELSRTELVFAQMTARGPRWPRAIGVVEIIVGFLLTILGTVEVFALPLIESKDGSNLIILDKGNCYGVGCIAGLAMLVTGSTAIRATLSKRDTTIFRFFNMTILSLIIYTGMTLFLIVAYAKGWTSPSNYEPGSKMGDVHMFVTIVTVIGLLFAMSGFVQYFDVICCGTVPLWTQWANCFCGCIYKRQGRLSIRDSLRAEFSFDNNPI